MRTQATTTAPRSRGVATLLVTGLVASTALACSDGAQPSTYRPPLGTQTASASDATRCSSPVDCFDHCFCTGGAANECLAVCEDAGELGTTGSGISTTDGDPTVAGDPAITTQSTPTPSGDPGTNGAPAAAACVPALPPATQSEFLCDPNGALACQNCGDCRQIIDGSAKQAATDCGVQCGGSRDCAEACIAGSTTLSGGCSSCLVDFFDCLVGNCLSECLGLTPDACAECSRSRPSAANSCSVMLEQCSGAERNPALGAP